MLRQGYQAEFATGTVAAVGTLGILIPPSIMLVLMADRLAISVGDLFLGALLPGLLLSALYIAFIVTNASLRPGVAPAVSHAQPITLDLLGALAKSVLPPILLIFAVLGSIFFGLATPTEAAGVGAFGAVVLTWMAGRLSAR